MACTHPWPSSKANAYWHASDSGDALAAAGYSGAHVLFAQSAASFAKFGIVIKNLRFFVIALVENMFLLT